jgi:hypothetical protein
MAGGGRITAPQATAWGTTDVTAIDPDGHTVVFTAPPSRLPTAGAPAGFTMETFH